MIAMNVTGMLEPRIGSRLFLVVDGEEWKVTAPNQAT
jgi:hypothetical protein